MLLGTVDNPIEKLSRNLVANNPACQDKYVDQLTRYFEEYKICKWVERLYEQVKNKNISTQEVIDAYELLNKQITEFVLSSERKCRKPKQGTCGQ
eukprot:11401567-Ditylum_brightwellii.AAC.2